LAGTAEAGVYDGGMTALIRIGVIGCLLALAAGAWAEDAAAPASPTLRVLAWNIHHGEGEDGKLDLERIAGVIRKSAADVVFLQEVDDRTQRTGRVAQAEELARLTGLQATFGKAMDFQGGGYGNAILTRWAPTDVRVVPLPGGGEPRCALAVTVDVPGGVGKTTVVSTHLDVSSAASRERHAKELATAFVDHPHLVILGGDFNATPDEAPVAAFADPWLRPQKEGANTGTIPVGEPTREIDFILLKPAPGRKAPAVLRHSVIEEKTASDHRPVLMELHVPVSP
jgi:endonuclease/exonuclease/phosphatase family metal-dependent hydrolase